MRTRLTGIAILASCALNAHEGKPVEPHDVATAWSFDPFVVILLLLSAVLYAAGKRRYHGLRTWEKACYWAGWTFTAVAMVSPIHAMGEALFSAHMLQHEILMVLAAPLLVLGRPLAPFVWAVPQEARRPLARVFTSSKSAPRTRGPFTSSRSGRGTYRLSFRRPSRATWSTRHNT